MTELFSDLFLSGVLLTILCYGIGQLLRKRFRLAIFNPMLVAILLIIGFLTLTGVPYQTYADSSAILSALVTPATVCFAIPLYRQLGKLRRNYRAIFGGIAAGVVTSGVTVLAVALLCRMDHAGYVTLLPKSITNAIGIGIAEELGGIATITVVAILVTGVVGNVLVEHLCRLLRITEPVAVGVAIGSSAHIMGTARALELGEVQGAMSSLSLVVAGLLTVLAAPLFAIFIP